MQKPSILLRIASVYFLLIGICFAIPTISFQHFSFPEIGVLILSALPVIIHRQWLYKAFGILATGAGLWIFFALVSDFIDYISGKVISNPWAYFGVGFLLALSMLFFSGAMLYFGFKADETTEASEPVS